MASVPVKNSSHRIVPLACSSLRAPVLESNLRILASPVKIPCTLGFLKKTITRPTFHPHQTLANTVLLHHKRAQCASLLRQTKVVELDVSSGTGLGFRLKKNQNGGFLIRSVDDEGLAKSSGQIKANDYLISVNGEDVSTMTQIKDVGKHIKSATTTLTLTFRLSAADVKAGKKREKKKRNRRKKN